MLLENEAGERLLIDCGGDIRFSLYEQGLTGKDIQAVFISHLHADHTGGLEWLAFNSYFGNSKSRPVLYISNQLDQDLWNHVLSGGLKSLANTEAKLSTFFRVKKVEKTFVWSGIKFTLVRTLHSESAKKLNPSFGLAFEVNGCKVFISCDTKYIPHVLSDYYEVSDTIFHDCETSPQPSGVHAQYQELLQLAPEIKKKMWLYHYNPGKRPDPKRGGFQGFVKKGQCFDFSTFSKAAEWS